MKNLIIFLAVDCLPFFTANAAIITVTQITDNGTGATSGSLSRALNTAAATGNVIAFNLTTGDVSGFSDPKYNGGVIKMNGTSTVMLNRCV